HVVHNATDFVDGKRYVYLWPRRKWSRCGRARRSNYSAYVRARLTSNAKALDDEIVCARFLCGDGRRGGAVPERSPNAGAADGTATDADARSGDAVRRRPLS